MKKNISRYVLQMMIGVLFGYFGIMALLEPETQAAIWLSQSSASLIEFIVPIAIFMLALGAMQVVVAFLLIADKYGNFALPLAAVLLLGIIINLGWNEIALRDLVILTGVLHLYFSKEVA